MHGADDPLAWRLGGSARTESRACVRPYGMSKPNQQGPPPDDRFTRSTSATARWHGPDSRRHVHHGQRRRLRRGSARPRGQRAALLPRYRPGHQRAVPRVLRCHQPAVSRFTALARPAGLVRPPAGPPGGQRRLPGCGRLRRLGRQAAADRGRVGVGGPRGPGRDVSLGQHRSGWIPGDVRGPVGAGGLARSAAWYWPPLYRAGEVVPGERVWPVRDGRQCVGVV